MDFNISKEWQDWDDIMNFIKATKLGDDRGLVFSEQISVGTKDAGKESVFGSGDSYAVESAFLYNTSNETGNVITSGTDVTAILQSDSVSAVNMFKDNLSGDVMLIGANNPWYGVKMKYDDNGSLEPENVVAEYMNNVGDWANQTFMVTNSNSPYERAGWNLSTYLSEQVRFAHSLLNSVSDWELTTLNINGINVTKYWGRLRLTSPITAVPVVQQVKHHTNRAEINADGMFEMFGNARGIKDLITLSYANNLSDPSNENVVYFTGGIDGGSAKIIDNEFANNTRDSRILIIKVDDDVDTSTPLLISYPFYVKGTATGEVRFDVEYVQIDDLFYYNTKSEPDGAFNQIYPIDVPSEFKRQILQFEVPINEINPNIGGVAVVITRDANATEDTLTSNIILAGDNARARRWRL